MARIAYNKHIALTKGVKIAFWLGASDKTYKTAIASDGTRLEWVGGELNNIEADKADKSDYGGHGLVWDRNPAPALLTWLYFHG